MALIAPFAQMARSTNRSTSHHGDHWVPATERYRRRRVYRPGLRQAAIKGQHKAAGFAGFFDGKVGVTHDLNVNGNINTLATSS